MNTVTLNLEPLIELTHDNFYQICQANPEIAFELTAQGELVIVSPVGGEGGSQEADLISQVWTWNCQTQLGIVFSSSTIFRLPNRAERSPDVAWVRLKRWESLTAEEQKAFSPICPDFAIELRSPSDRLKPLQAKMQEYIDNGLRLGWLIDPQNRRVEIYRPEQAVEVLASPTSLSGENVLPGLVVDVSQILKAS
ncbi:MAG: Uma2 family endonuclease [Cyanosarcina radialis HA8281-LM2]|jgi:Uma2 family endonuclease|nr:Uma2 family endonuclease [Cyanosarcina radialis HA8281-LM2]